MIFVSSFIQLLAFVAFVSATSASHSNGKTTISEHKPLCVGGIKLVNAIKELESYSQSLLHTGSSQSLNVKHARLSLKTKRWDFWGLFKSKSQKNAEKEKQKLQITQNGQPVKPNNKADANLKIVVKSSLEHLANLVGKQPTVEGQWEAIQTFYEYMQDFQRKKKAKIPSGENQFQQVEKNMLDKLKDEYCIAKPQLMEVARLSAYLLHVALGFGALIVESGKGNLLKESIHNLIFGLVNTFRFVDHYIK